MNAETNNIQRIQENDPTVSMDISLRDSIPQGQTLGFDYDAYHAMADKAAGRPVDMSDLSIQVKPKVFAARGTYNDEYKYIEATYYPHSPEKTRKNLQHETQHYIDGQNGEFLGSGFHRATYVAANITSRLAMPAYIANFAAFEGSGLLEQAGIHSALTDHLAEVAQTNPKVMWIIPAIGVTATARYLMEPTERRARKTAKMEAEPVLKLRQSKDSQ